MGWEDKGNGCTFTRPEGGGLVGLGEEAWGMAMLGMAGWEHRWIYPRFASLMSVITTLLLYYEARLRAC